MLKDFYQLKRENNPYREDAFTLSCLGKIHPASSLDFSKFRRYLSELIDNSISSNEYQNFKNSKILIIGLTESGIIPALLMYIETIERNLNTSILYSTRRPSLGIPFKESHSHGPNHILPLPLFSQAERGISNHNFKFQEIWIVEDEITSGNTVYNLIVQLCQYLKISRVRVFAFADFRDNQQKQNFTLKTALNSIQCSIHALNAIEHGGMNCIEHGGINYGKTLNNADNKTSSIYPNPLPLQTNNISKVDALNNWHLPEKRPALAIKSGNFINSDLWDFTSCKFSSDKFSDNKLSSKWIEFNNFHKKTILVVGEAVDLAACFALTDKNIRFQQISLSPWKVDNISILSKIAFANKYYLYNYENLKDRDLNPVFILCDPIDKNIECEAVNKLKEVGIDVKPIFY